MENTTTPVPTLTATPVSNSTPVASTVAHRNRRAILIFFISIVVLIGLGIAFFAGAYVATSSYQASVATQTNSFTSYTSSFSSSTVSNVSSSSVSASVSQGSTGTSQSSSVTSSASGTLVKAQLGYTPDGSAASMKRFTAEVAAPAGFSHTVTNNNTNNTELIFIKDNVQLVFDFSLEAQTIDMQSSTNLLNLQNAQIADGVYRYKTLASQRAAFEDGSSNIYYFSGTTNCIPGVPACHLEFLYSSAVEVIAAVQCKYTGISYEAAAALCDSVMSEIEFRKI